MRSRVRALSGVRMAGLFRQFDAGRPIVGMHLQSGSASRGPVASIARRDRFCHARQNGIVGESEAGNGPVEPLASAFESAGGVRGCAAGSQRVAKVAAERGEGGKMSIFSWTLSNFSALQSWRSLSLGPKSVRRAIEPRRRYSRSFGNSIEGRKSSSGIRSLSGHRTISNSRLRRAGETAVRILALCDGRRSPRHTGLDTGPEGTAGGG